VKRKALATKRSADYEAMLDRVVRLIDEARRTSARSVNALMTATYWFIGRHIVEFEQAGKSKAQYGEEVIDQLAADLTSRFGRGFTQQSFQHARLLFGESSNYPHTVWTIAAA